MMQTMLIHTQHQWPSAILANLWPYALQMATDVLNVTPNLKLKDGQTPLESFASTKITCNPKALAPFWMPCIHIIPRTPD